MQLDVQIQHFMRVVRTLRYLRNSGDYCIELKPGKSIVPEIYADASHLSHHDAKGHGCMTVTLGNGGYIFARSSKLKLTAASATESEHYCLCEAAMYNIWLRYAKKFKSQIGSTNNYSSRQ
jgi:hypothetical protein